MSWNSKRFRINDKLIAILLSLVLLLAGYLQMVVGVCGVYHDDAIYVSTAKALAHGQGYRLINFPDSPKQTKYPILYPVLLAIVWKLWPLFPDNLLFMQCLTLLIGSVAIGLCYLYLVKFGYASRKVAFFSCLLSVSSQQFIYFTTNTLSEIPFLLLVVLMLGAFESEIREPSGSRIRHYILGILLGLPFLCRSIGVVFIFVGIIIWYRNDRPIRWITLGAITVTFPWILWVLIGLRELNQDPFTGYYTNYLNWWSQFGAPFIGRVLSYNLLMILVGTVNSAMPGIHHWILSLKFTGWLVFSLFFGLIPWINTLFENRQENLLRWFLMGYLGTIFLWPWPPHRFLVPMIPFIIVNFMLGIGVMLRRLSFLPGFKGFIIGGIGILIASNLILMFYQFRVNQQTHYPQPAFSETKVSWIEYQEIFRWLIKNSQPNDVIASGIDSMMYLYTGRRAIRPFIAHPPSLFYGQGSLGTGTLKDLCKILKTYRPKYLIHTPMPGFSEEKPFSELLRKLREKYPGWLEPIYVGEDPRFIIFELNSQLEP
jgi:hypothetical protein